MNMLAAYTSYIDYRSHRRWSDLVYWFNIHVHNTLLWVQGLTLPMPAPKTVKKG